MLTRPVHRLDLFFRKEWKQLLFVSAYSVGIVLLDHVIPIKIPSYGAVILGTAISILLAFRTHAAYDRWWEARKVWGGIVNDSRNLVRELISFTSDPDPAPLGPSAALIRGLVYRQSAWAWILARRLRGTEQLEGLEEYFTDEEYLNLRSHANAPLQILTTQSSLLKRMADAGYLPLVLLLRLDTVIASLVDHQGQCERIKNTVFPQNYAAILKWIIVLFYLVVPLAVVEDLGWSTVFFVLVLGMVFQMIETISDYIEIPLDNILSGTPMYALSRTIEIDLLRMIDEPELPEPLVPQNGILV